MLLDAVAWVNLRLRFQERSYPALEATWSVMTITRSAIDQVEYRSRPGAGERRASAFNGWSS